MKHEKTKDHDLLAQAQSKEAPPPPTPATQTHKALSNQQPPEKPTPEKMTVRLRESDREK